MSQGTINKVILIGRLGGDPESKFTPTGKKVCAFSIATNESWTDANGEKKSVTDWHNIEVWGKLGEICQQYLKKGQRVYIEGRIKTEKYETGGETKYYTKVVAREMQMLSDRGTGGMAGESGEGDAGSAIDQEGDVGF